jgi:hypothetical protein
MKGRHVGRKRVARKHAAIEQPVEQLAGVCLKGPLFIGLRRLFAFVITLAWWRSIAAVHRTKRGLDRAKAIRREILKEQLALRIGKLTRNPGCDPLAQRRFV